MNHEVIVDFYMTNSGLGFIEQSKNVRHDLFLQGYSSIIG